jgi:hypothetical protein
MSVIVRRMCPHLYSDEAIFKAAGCDAIGDILLFLRDEVRDTDRELFHALKLAVEELLQSGPTDPDLVEIYGDDVPEWVHTNLKALHDEMMTIPPGMTQPPHG